VGGPLFRFDLTDDRHSLDVEELEAENENFNSLIGSEEFVIGTGFGIVTDIETGPDGNLYIVSLNHGAIYEIFQRSGPALVALVAEMNGEKEVPGPGDPDGTGGALVILDEQENEICYAITVQDIILPAIGAHIHIGGPDVAGPVVVPLANPDETGASAGCASNVDPALVSAIVQNPENYYVNVHTTDFPAGAVRGQLAEVESSDSESQTQGLGLSAFLPVIHR
jgi:hypothetical protein